jgi:nitrite reductase/ring-hydroxylating ferredoxin subunit
MAPKTQTVAIPAAQLQAYPAGRATCAKLGGVAVIVFRGADGAVKVAPNVCVHMGAAFGDMEDAGKMTCSFHGATLDPATMTYLSAPKALGGMGTKVEKGTAHPTFPVTLNADGSASVELPVAGGCEVA